MNLDKDPTTKKISRLEEARRDRSVSKMKQYVVRSLLKGQDVVPARTSRLSGALEATLNPHSQRNLEIVNRVQGELSEEGIHVVAVDDIMDADSTDGYLYGFKAVKPKEVRPDVDAESQPVHESKQDN